MAKLSMRRIDRAVRVRAAMPDVQAVIAKHGAKTVAICLRRLKQYAVELARIERLRRETSQLEKRVGL